MNTKIATGPDGISGRVLKLYADQLAPVFTMIFILSLAQSVIPKCFKKSTTIPVLKKTRPACLNDYCPVALISVVMKCIERLVKDYVCSSLRSTMDPVKFAYHPNRSTEDTTAHNLHTTLSHLDKKGSYVRLLFVDYSSAFNTIVPSRLLTKLKDLGLNTSIPDGQNPGGEGGLIHLFHPH